MSDETEIVNVIDQVSKSVVNINTLRVLRDYYHRTVPVRGMGSGFIFDSQGYILTNHHVIANSDRFLVTLADGKSIEGRIVGSLRSSDIAVIKINGSDFLEAELGDSDEIKVGQRAFAIGNPFGLPGGPTVTSGVISALNRTITGREGTFSNLVQTDAAINPGNSGGPLINDVGQVIGICTAIIPYAQGIGFAVPINAAKEFTRDIITYGKTVRPWLGITGLNITRNMAQQYGLGVDRGVYVVEVARDSPASKTSFGRGDIILELGSNRIDTIEQLQQGLEKRRIGERVEFTIMRGGRRGKVSAVLEPVP